MKNKDFAIFILTHGRPNNIHTVSALKRAGYTGRVFFIIDNEDDSAEEYKKLYGDKVIVFDKIQEEKETDKMDNFEGRTCILFARNAVYKIAERIGIKYFLQLDDDYTKFQYRFDYRFNYRYKAIKNLDVIIDAIIDFYKSIPATRIAMAQGGDFIGGVESQISSSLKLKRKCMNTFFCSTDRPAPFAGRMNEDVNAYTYLASKGHLFFTLINISVVQMGTQSLSGGMSEEYRQSGTYVKSFYSVMCSPSCVKVSSLQTVNQRIHHQVKWGNAVPVILSEEYKKK